MEMGVTKKTPNIKGTRSIKKMIKSQRNIKMKNTKIKRIKRRKVIQNMKNHMLNLFKLNKKSRSLVS